MQPFFVADYDIVVIGAGHAGVEAALAAARLGRRTLMATISMDNISLMPCNPSVGGPAKGHLVREIDALGGEMGLTADKAAIQYRMLNTGKGPAVQALRSQADKKLYQFTMKEICERQKNLDVKQLLIEEILVEDGCVTGVVAETGETYGAKAVIIATGTYLRGRIIIGETTYDGGPNGQRAAARLSDSLTKLGLALMRFKTGTPARVSAATLDYDKMEIQPGDDEPRCFSFLSDETAATRDQIPCWLTYTNEATHKVILDNIDRAPMANGLIKGVGPRYCPSIESKLLRFPDKERHQLFVEPEGRHTAEMYVQGMSTSLPTDVQLDFLHTIPGLEKAQVMRVGYAIEYDCLDPTQLKPSLETKKIAGLFSAGQSNGTSGYEEAAAQGLMAGINASRLINGLEPVILGRDEAYIGVLIDDLVTKGTAEPYRMMTSRAEYRLVLRQDNADLRLTPIGRRVGLVQDDRWEYFCRKRDALENALKLLHSTILTPTEELLAKLAAHDIAPIRAAVSLFELLKRQDMTYEKICPIFGLPPVAPAVAEQINITARYEGYIRKQQEQIEKMRRLEEKLFPPGFDFRRLTALSEEAREKLAAIAPRTVAQAGRISGVSPADVSVLLVALEERRRERAKTAPAE